MDADEIGGFPEERPPPVNIRQRVIAIKLGHDGCHNAIINDVLCLLRDLGHDVIIISKYKTGSLKKSIVRTITLQVPKDSRTLMHTDTTPIGDATFHHIPHGLDEGIEQHLRSGILFDDNIIKLELNIDGIPIFKSPVTGFWPVLCRVIGVKERFPFLVSSFCGPGKPEDVHRFLQPVIDDILRLEREGFLFNGRRFEVRLERAVCDTPARSFCKVTIGHNGYGACERCSQKGRYVRGRTTFPKMTGLTLRDNASFRRMHVTITARVHFCSCSI